MIDTSHVHICALTESYLGLRNIRIDQVANPFLAISLCACAGKTLKFSCTIIPPATMGSLFLFGFPIMWSGCAIGPDRWTLAALRALNSRANGYGDNGLHQGVKLADINLIIPPAAFILYKNIRLSSRNPLPAPVRSLPPPPPCPP
jgi:hypothetical protein